MDVQSPSVRITRGNELHGPNINEIPSFSLGLTQGLGDALTGSIAKSKAAAESLPDEESEVRSKHKNDPEKMQQIIQKSVAKVIKSVQLKKKSVVEIGSSRKRKASQIDSNTIDQNQSQRSQAGRFLLQQPLRKAPHMQCYTNTNIMEDLSTTLTEYQLEVFCKTTCFAQLTTMRNLEVQAQLFRCFMMRELEGSSTDAFLFDANGTTLRFSRMEFALVSGLKCGDDKTGFKFNTDQPNRILEQYFPNKKVIFKAELVESFSNKVWGDNDDDAIKFAILYFIHTFIMSEELIGTVIGRLHFDLVESGKYMNYPWATRPNSILSIECN